MLQCLTVRMPGDELSEELACVNLHVLIALRWRSGTLGLWGAHGQCNYHLMSSIWGSWGLARALFERLNGDIWTSPEPSNGIFGVPIDNQTAFQGHSQGLARALWSSFESFKVKTFGHLRGSPKFNSEG